MQVSFSFYINYISFQRSEGIAVDPSAAMANDTIYQVIRSELYSQFVFIFCFFSIVYPVFKTDPTATEHAEEVDPRVRGRD